MKDRMHHNHKIIHTTHDNVREISDNPHPPKTLKGYLSSRFSTVRPYAPALGLKHLRANASLPPPPRKHFRLSHPTNVEYLGFEPLHPDLLCHQNIVTSLQRKNASRNKLSSSRSRFSNMLRNGMPNRNLSAFWKNQPKLKTPAGEQSASGQNDASKYFQTKTCSVLKSWHKPKLGRQPLLHRTQTISALSQPTRYPNQRQEAEISSPHRTLSAGSKKLARSIEDLNSKMRQSLYQMGKRFSPCPRDIYRSVITSSDESFGCIDASQTFSFRRTDRFRGIDQRLRGHSRNSILKKALKERDIDTEPYARCAARLYKSANTDSRSVNCSVPGGHGRCYATESPYLAASGSLSQEHLKNSCHFASAGVQNDQHAFARCNFNCKDLPALPPEAREVPYGSCPRLYKVEQSITPTTPLKPTKQVLTKYASSQQQDAEKLRQSTVSQIYFELQHEEGEG